MIHKEADWHPGSEARRKAQFRGFDSWANVLQWLEVGFRPMMSMRIDNPELFVVKMDNGTHLVAETVEELNRQCQRKGG